jgi:trehalose 6-phosphate phosphatase
MMLDFDGTLVDIAPTPDSIQFSSEDAALLAKLEDAHGGAVAIVSGRAIDDLEQYLTSFGGLIAGGHGAEFRIDGRRSLAGEVDESQLEEIKQAVISFGKSDPRILLEHKSTGIVMHYRAHPECESDVIELAKSLVEKRPDFKLQFAKMAVEIKPAAAFGAIADTHDRHHFGRKFDSRAQRHHVTHSAERQGSLQPGDRPHNINHHDPSSWRRFGDGGYGFARV